MHMLCYTWSHFAWSLHFPSGWGTPAIYQISPIICSCHRLLIPKEFIHAMLHVEFFPFSIFCLGASFDCKIHRLCTLCCWWGFKRCKMDNHWTGTERNDGNQYISCRYFGRILCFVNSLVMYLLLTWRTPGGFYWRGNWKHQWHTECSTNDLWEGLYYHSVSLLQSINSSCGLEPDKLPSSMMMEAWISCSCCSAFVDLALSLFQGFWSTWHRVMWAWNMVSRWVYNCGQMILYDKTIQRHSSRIFCWCLTASLNLLIKIWQLRYMLLFLFSSNLYAYFLDWSCDSFTKPSLPTCLLEFSENISLYFTLIWWSFNHSLFISQLIHIF